MVVHLEDKKNHNILDDSRRLPQFLHSLTLIALPPLFSREIEREISFVGMAQRSMVRRDNSSMEVSPEENNEWGQRREAGM